MTDRDYHAIARLEAAGPALAEVSEILRRLLARVEELEKILEELRGRTWPNCKTLPKRGAK